jgi:Pyridoxal-phosphate dependent enzyme
MATTVPATAPTITDRLRALERLIGNTPLLAIDYELRGRKRTIFAKSEQMNLTGSIKDRMALHIIRKAYAEGRLHAGDTIVEASNYPPAEPEALRLLAPQRGLIATDQSQKPMATNRSGKTQDALTTPKHTPGFVKLLLPPRQSRGVSLRTSILIPI